MNPNFEKLNNLTQIQRADGYIGFFEPKNNFHKLMAYAKRDGNEIRFLWIHRDCKQ